MLYLQSNNHTLTDLEIFSYINSFCRILPDICFIFKCKHFVIRGRIVDTYIHLLTSLCDGLDGRRIAIRFQAGHIRIFLSPKLPDRIWGSHLASSLTDTGISFPGGTVTRGGGLTIKLHVESRLQMSGVIPYLPYTPFWREQKQIFHRHY